MKACDACVTCSVAVQSTWSLFPHRSPGSHSLSLLSLSSLLPTHLVSCSAASHSLPVHAAVLSARLKPPKLWRPLQSEFSLELWTVRSGRGSDVTIFATLATLRDFSVTGGFSTYFCLRLTTFDRVWPFGPLLKNCFHDVLRLLCSGTGALSPC